MEAKTMVIIFPKEVKYKVVCVVSVPFAAWLIDTKYRHVYVCPCILHSWRHEGRGWTEREVGQGLPRGWCDVTLDGLNQDLPFYDVPKE